MKVLESGPEPRQDRAASMMLHNEANVRIVAFRLEPGQTIAPHRSPSTVTVHVTDGAGNFIGEDGEAWLEVGEAAVYEPDELHAIEAKEESLRFLALITPSPGG